MPRFRKRPVVVTAEQWFPDREVDGVCIGDDPQRACWVRPIDFAPNASYPHVHTLEGPLRVSPGDWIITGVKGEKYPCKPDVFEATYEEVTGQ